MVRTVGRPQSVTPFSFLLFFYFFGLFINPTETVQSWIRISVGSIIFYCFFVEARSASRIPNCSTGCSLSPSSASEVSPDNR